jgi:peptidoglycan-N-acetylglucosamine deacetylase
LGQAPLKLNALAWPYIIAFNMFAFAALITAWNITSYSDAQIAKRKVQSEYAVSQTKRIAFSFDDTPRAPGAFLDVKQRPAMLIKAMEDGGIKGAAFFTNPGRISGINKGADAISADVFLADVDKAKIWLKPHKNYRPWLRFPRLDEGRKDRVKRDAVRAGLEQRGIRNAYVTADGWDWYMESRTKQAKRAGKAIDMGALRALYIETHVESANFSDRLAKRILGRRPVQMLLLHDTDLAAMYVDDLAKALRADGWQIVTADVAYADPLASMTPNPEFADGTRLEMLAWDKDIRGNRWFPRNNIPVARKQFATRVLGE